MDQETQKKEMLNKMKERKKEVKTVRKIVFIIAFAFIIVAAIISISMYFYVSGALKPVDSESNKTVKIEVPIGSTIDSIAVILEKKNIIKDAKVFKYYTKFKNESEFQAGTYKLTKAMTIDEIIKSLKTGKVYRQPTSTLTIPEGLTLDQIGARIAKNTTYTTDEFMTLVTSKEFVKNMKSKYPELITKKVNNKDIRYVLEGYLYPSTYSFFAEDPTLEEIVEQMIAQTNTVVTQYSVQLKEKKMSVHEFLTFASLLEREATAKTDRETIASVFYNRLETGMPLQTDPTVLYALGEHKDRVLYKDLEVKHPYNTYKVKGLPPGPIANAGKESLDAAISPADTPYLYFLADKNGINHFAEKYEDHLKNVDKYIK
ncbi:endolytic transglycosylase MltG [Viridibacillus sp. YIM B01967]|uniref:Endolytic murein transglycosylase n=1 Tax=Viridibacillus soli TaxID=2798301 RepID=A0ABS1H1W8_9BACL|nr:endolytic transglycosylase MltG [Viridibacillus soli]MBK3493369.1 endolytic transglycosylase MltG [Viridibacillus soli]